MGKCKSGLPGVGEQYRQEIKQLRNKITQLRAVIVQVKEAVKTTQAKNDQLKAENEKLKICKECKCELPMHRLGCAEAKGETDLYAKIEQLQAENKTLKGEKEKLNSSIERWKKEELMWHEIDNKLQAELETHHWIPVLERLPEKDADCLCFEGKFAGLGCYQQNSNSLRMQWQVNGFVSNRVTHWKPLILPPKEQNEHH